jgi:hypothetical protein
LNFVTNIELLQHLTSSLPDEAIQAGNLSCVTIYRALEHMELCTDNFKQLTKDINSIFYIRAGNNIICNRKVHCAVKQAYIYGL